MCPHRFAWINTLPWSWRFAQAGGLVEKVSGISAHAYLLAAPAGGAFFLDNRVGPRPAMTSIRATTFSLAESTAGPKFDSP